MRGLRATLLVAALAAMPLSGAHAVQPDEILADPLLEQRARDLSSGLRCLVCQNESIDASNAPLARDLRLLVRQRLEAGDTDREVEDYLVSRYGEFVLLQPRVSWQTMALWSAPVLLLLAGGGFVALTVRRGRRPVTAGLSAEEERRIAELLRER